MEALKFINDSTIFSDLGAASLQALARASRFKSLKKGEILFLQSDPSEAAYIVCSGNISIILNSLDGHEMVINNMRAGDMFGELGVLTRQPRSTSAVARGDSELLVIPRLAFLRVLDDEPQLARRVLTITANRLQQSSEREGALAFKDAQARLAHILLALEKEEHTNGYITISQDELAARAGLIRQTVAKALGKWRRNGWLLTGRGRLVLLDHHALEELENKLLV